MLIDGSPLSQTKKKTNSSLINLTNQAKIIYEDKNEVIRSKESIQSNQYGLEYLDDAEAYEPEFNEPKSIEPHEIKSKLSDFQSTEGVLPQVQKDEINVKKAAEIKHSPLPHWLEQLITEYTRIHQGSLRKNLLNFIIYNSVYFESISIKFAFIRFCRVSSKC